MATGIVIKYISVIFDKVTELFRGDVTKYPH